MLTTLLVACGKKGAPLPPEPRGPLPPGNVVARQIGGSVVVLFDVPPPRGSRYSQRPVRAELVRVEYAPGQQAPADPDAFRRRGVRVGAVEADPLESGSRARFIDATVAPADRSFVGWKLRYGVRVLDRRGRSSPLVVARDLVPLDPPPPPSRLVGEPTADGVRLTWRPPPIDNARFNVYRVAEGGTLGERPLNAAPLTSPVFLDDSVVPGTVYRYQVRTSAADPPPFRESVSSEDAVIIAEDLFAPAAPSGLVAVQERLAVRLFWNPNDELDLAGYRVYRRFDDGPWRRIGPDPVPEPLYLDEQVEIERRVTYRVTAIDKADPPNESEPSETAELEVAQEPASPGEAR